MMSASKFKEIGDDEQEAFSPPVRLKQERQIGDSDSDEEEIKIEVKPVQKKELEKEENEGSKKKPKNLLEKDYKSHMENMMVMAMQNQMKMH